MRKIHCLNAIANVGTDIFDENYKLTDNIEEADAIMVRSAAMGDMEFSENLLAIARAGAGVNNIPLERCADAGIVVFNTPGANANGVKELVICGMLLAARDVVGGIEWTRSIKDSDTIAKDVEKGKKNFAGGEIKGKKLGVIGLGAIGAEVANAAASRKPNKITEYIISLVKVYHSYYNSSRVNNPEDPELTNQRLGLVKATMVTLKNALNLVGVEAPESM